MTHWRFSFQHPTSLGSLCHWPRSQTPVAGPCAARTVLAMLVGYHPKVLKPTATGCMKNTWQVFETHKASSQSICCYGPGVASDRLDPFDVYDDMIIEEIKHGRYHVKYEWPILYPDVDYLVQIMSAIPWHRTHRPFTAASWTLPLGTRPTVCCDASQQFLCKVAHSLLNLSTGQPSSVRRTLGWFWWPKNFLFSA